MTQFTDAQVIGDRTVVVPDHWLRGSWFTGYLNETSTYLLQRGVHVSRIGYAMYRDQVPIDSRAQLSPQRGVWLREGTQDAQFFGERRTHDMLNIGPDDVVLDVGGNCGLFSIYACERGAGVVACIEADPSNANLAQRNFLQRECSTRIVMLRAAIVPDSFEATKAILYLNSGKNLGIHSLMARRGRAQLEVDAVQWTDVMQTIGPTVVKVDIEGGEYTLMNELAHLPTRVRAIYCEMHLTNAKWRREYAPALYDALNRQGFRAVRVPDVDPSSKRWDTCYAGVR
jgi:FkbM family methyltransferase